MWIFKEFWFWFLVFIVLFFFAVYKGAEKSYEISELCKSKGGIPITERGIYKACAKPENFINLKDEK